MTTPSPLPGAATTERAPFDLTAPLVRGGMLLEASAGTGKTYSIASLVVRLVAEEGVPIDQILTVTFTNAATAELRERVRRRLTRTLEAVEASREEQLTLFDDGKSVWSGDRLLDHIIRHAHGSQEMANVLGRLRTAIESFDRAQISTIHGFCQRMLQQNALASGASFETNLVDSEKAVIREVVEDFWLKELFHADKPVLAALEPLGLDLKTATALGELAASHPDAPVVPPDPGVDAPPPLPRLAEAQGRLAEAWRAGWRSASDALETALSRGALDPRGYSKAKLKDGKDALWRLLDGSIARVHMNAARVFDAAFIRRCTPAGGIPPTSHVYDCVKDLRDAYKEEVKGALDFALSFRHRLITRVRAEVVRRREERAERSYDDLLRILRDALDPQRSETAALLANTIRSQYRAVLIDEFQDTDPVQWAIFKQVFLDQDDHWLYLIGDPKQAIYRFRGADIHTYIAVQEHFDARGRVRTLATSYRSDERLVRAQNALFGWRDGPFANRAIAYEPVGHTHDNDRFPDAAAGVRVRFVARRRKRRTIDTDWRNRDLPKRVARDIAKTLHGKARLREAQTGPDGKPSVTTRAVAPRDCAVLVRTNPQARDIQSALREYGIPSVLHGPDSVFDTDEAAELERLLAAILEPSRTTLARTALATELMGQDAAAIDRLDGTPEAWEAWVGELRAWQRMWSEHSFVHMFRDLVAGPITHVLGWKDGERRMANLLHLGELLHRAAVEEELQPAGLVDWLRLARRGAADGEDAQQLRLESDADAVEVVTIHKSKGLEYPLVWCPYLFRPEKEYRGHKHQVFHDPDDGDREKIDIGPDFKQWADHAHQVGYELSAEGLRLLYVALTRASHQCTLWWGGFYDADRSPLWYLFNREAAATSADDLDEAMGGKLAEWDDSRLVERVEALVARSGGAVALEHELSDNAEVPPWQPATPEAAGLSARAYRRSAELEDTWRRTSFSGLTRDVPFVPEAAQSAADEVTPEDDGAWLLAADDDSAKIPWADLPKGRGTGNFLHKVLELADFQWPRAPMRALVAEQLPVFGLDGEVWADRVTDGLLDALHAPLGRAEGPATLSALTLAQRFNELDFTFPLAGGSAIRGGEALDPAGLARVFASVAADHPHANDWVERLEALTFAPARGFLTGSIDLTFRDAQGRWYLADYKSNHLGETVADYGPEGVAHAISHHHYFLQYHLYTVGLWRYLSWRIPGFDYERDFGGVYYLFLRGMSAGHPPGTGVYYDRPALPLVAALAARLDGERR
ncbi:MAG: exodeoxyribonuclease V subunit beta [Proteobacteria bacterium]|nr:MAG: exodeoxyribonuclease V subunit beta [Pseudomonadota bacterium]